MNTKQWAEIKNFKSSENWGDAEMMDLYFMKFLDTVRHLYGHPFVLTSPAYTKGTGHSDKSYHYLGRACDFYVPDLAPDTAFWRMCDVLEDMGIMKDKKMLHRGFGFYPDWFNRQGFHIDDRDAGKFWVRVDKLKHGFKPNYYYDEKGWDIIDALGWETILTGIKRIIKEN